MRHFLVKYGYSQQDQISITEKELEKAIYAQIKKTPVKLGTSYINGSNIIAIRPHYHKHTGWYDYYEPKDGEDWKQIERDCPPYEGVIDYYQERVRHLVKTNQTNLIGKDVEIKELPKPEFTHFDPEPKSISSEVAKKLSLS